VNISIPQQIVVRSHISQTGHSKFVKFSVHVACGGASGPFLAAILYLFCVVCTIYGEQKMNIRCTLEFTFCMAAPEQNLLSTTTIVTHTDRIARSQVAGARGEQMCLSLVSVSAL